MSKIKGKGIPTRKTAGAIGDIYIDTSTGKQYKCTNAYGVNGQYDYTWRAQKVEQSNQNEKVETKTEPKVEKKVEEKPVVAEAKAEEPVKEEVKDVEPVAESEEAPVKGKKRTNYAAAYDNKKTK